MIYASRQEGNVADVAAPPRQLCCLRLVHRPHITPPEFVFISQRRRCNRDHLEYIKTTSLDFIPLSHFQHVQNPKNPRIPTHKLFTFATSIFHTILKSPLPTLQNCNSNIPSSPSSWPRLPLPHQLVSLNRYINRS